MRRSAFVIIVVLIVATSCVYAVFAHDMAAACARLAGRSQTIETAFGTMEYAEIGEGEPLLIVHGAEGGFDQGLDMTGAMAERGYRLIAPSRFGYLRSTMPGNPHFPSGHRYVPDLSERAMVSSKPVQRLHVLRLPKNRPIN